MGQFLLEAGISSGSVFGVADAARHDGEGGLRFRPVGAVVHLGDSGLACQEKQSLLDQITIGRFRQEH